MNFNILSEYIRLCKKYDKPITWEGLKLFKIALS